jgi:hypothetical protein
MERRMSNQVANIVVSLERPWLGLSSFTEETRDYFFGREREISDLLERIHNHPLTILFGLSGRGKTSLLGAGLLPGLRDAGARPVLLRLREDGTSFVEQIRSAWDLATGAAASDASLWERGYRKSERQNLLAQPPVLILDQFEEVFTLGHARTAELEALFREIACLVENRIPTALRERMAADDDFTEQFDDLLSPARIVITLREDYLAHLEGWKGILPALMCNRMALLPLSGPQALKAVLNPARLGSASLIDQPTAEAIVRFVAQRGDDIPLAEIEAVPPLLSLLCFELNEARLDMGVAQITLDQLEIQKEEILHNFYQRCFDGLPDAVRETVEGSLLVSESGHRNACAEVDFKRALARAGLEPATVEVALTRLVNVRLLTLETLGGIRRIELTHDLLTPLVEHSRNERDAQQQLQAAAASNIRLQQERRRWQSLSAAMALLLISAIIAVFNAWNAERRATEALIIAQNTVDEVLSTLENLEMDEVHGFYRIENQLLDRLVPLERQLDEIQGTNDTPEGVLRKVKLDLRAANRLRNDGHQLEAAPKYRAAYERIAALPDNQVSAELRDYQFQSMYRLNTMAYLFKPGEYDKQQMITTGTALFESSQTYPQGRFWRESFAQQMAQYLRNQQQTAQALVVLNRALTDLDMMAGDKPNAALIATKGELLEEISLIQEILGKADEARETRKAYYSKLNEYLYQHPRSRLFARQLVSGLFDQLDVAYWAKDGNAFERLVTETNAVIVRFSGSEANTFEAAAAQLLVKQSGFTLNVMADPERGFQFARDALTAYGNIYAGQTTELSIFATSGDAMFYIGAAMDDLEAKAGHVQREALRVQHGKELLELSAPFLPCAAKLGPQSQCHTIIDNATERARDRLQTDYQAIVDAVPLRQPLLLAAAAAMVERDGQQPATVPITDRVSTEPLSHYCALDRDYAKALVNFNHADDAIRVLKAAVTICESWYKQYDFDITLREALAGLFNDLAQAQQSAGDLESAHSTLDDCTALNFFICNAAYAEMLEKGQGGPQDNAKAAELRARKSNMKRITVPVRKKGGSELTFPFYFYISGLSGNSHYKGIDAQAIWLERNRGLIIPQEVRDFFIRLENNPREEHASFPGLRVYAMGTAQDDNAKKDKEAVNIAK